MGIANIQGHTDTALLLDDYD